MRFGSLIALMWWQPQNLLLTVIVLAGFAACIVLVMASAYGMIKLCKKIMPLFRYSWRNGLQHIVRYQAIATIQLMALSLGLLIVITIFLVRTDLIEQWQNKLPANTPNHFIINIQNYELDAVRDFFTQHQLQSENFYPMSPDSQQCRLSCIHNHDPQLLPQRPGHPNFAQQNVHQPCHVCMLHLR